MTQSSARANWARRNYCLAIMQLIFFTADTLTVRLLLAWASGIYAALLVWPEFANDIRLVFMTVAPDLVAWLNWDIRASVFDRPAYALMRVVPGGVWLWFWLFMLHMIGVHWRVFDPKAREGWALAINVLGFAVWAFATASLSISLGQILPTSSAEIVIVFFQFWAMFRTGLQKELLTP